MILKPGVRLEAFCAANVTTQPQVQVAFIDYGTDGVAAFPDCIRTALNHSTAVTIMPAAVNSKAREILSIHLYNADSATQSTTILSNDLSVSTIYVKRPVGSISTLAFVKNAGWQVV